MMKHAERAKAILCMEYLARQVCDEEVFEQWLVYGVPDGDIEYGCLDVSVIDSDDYFMNEQAFAELMKVFLDLMTDAKKYGGLYCDRIESN